jgi:MFS family permease
MERQGATPPQAGKKFFGITVLEGMSRWDFLNLYGATFFVGILIIIPAIIQPAFLKEVIGIPRNMSGSINSGLQNMSQIATLLFIGYIGALSDRVGRVVLAFIGFLICGLAYLIFGYTMPISSFLGINAIAFTYGARFLIAVGFIMTFPQFSTLAADYTMQRDRGKAMSYNGFMLGMAGIFVFNVIAQIPKQFGIMSLFYICVVTAIIGATWLKAALRDRLPERTVKEHNFKELVQTVKKSLALKVGYAGYLVSRADTIIIGTLLMVWAVESARQYGLTPLQATAVGGTALGIQMIVAVSCNPILGYLIDRFGRVPMIILGLFLSSVGFGILGLVGNPFSKIVWLAVGLIGASQASVAISCNALCADAAPKALLGTVMGGKNTMAPIGTIIFLQLGGFLFDTLGPMSAFLMKASVNVLVFIWVFAIRKKVILGELSVQAGG